MVLYRYNNMKRWILILTFFIGSTSVSFSQVDSIFWWNDAVFYEVFVRSFKDANGDGKGDFQGLIEKLDYLNDGDPSTHSDLGVTAIWLMPIQQSPSYHGYDVMDYRTIEQDYGTNTDFQNFITEAHNRGIKVIIDYVMNHTSSQHPWFQSSLTPANPERDWYIWQPTNPGVTGPWGQTVWHPRSGSYNYGIFWSEMPDLNYNNQDVEDEMFDIAQFWLEDMNVDGFRLDAIRYIKEDGNTLQDIPETIDFLKEFKNYYKSVNPDAMAVGEAWAATEIVQGYMADTSLDFCFEFDLATAILNAANSGSPAALSAQTNEVMTSYPFLQFGTFLTNHDMNRVMDQLGNSTPKAKLAASLLLTLPGVPYIYYGEEIGMNGSGVDENKRRPLHWNAGTQAGFTTGTSWRTLSADYTTKNIEAQQKESTSLWNNYRRLISIRTSQAALRRGDYKSLTATSSSIYSFLRQYEEENIIVVSNTSATAVTNFQLSLTPSGIAPGNYTLVELQGGNQVSVTIDGTGGFTGLPISSISAQTTFIYKLMDPSEVSTTVTFQVDMNDLIGSGDFVTSESVDIVATFNNFGTSTTTVLTDVDQDGVYTVTVPNIEIGSIIHYKYRINGVNNGREEFAGNTFFREFILLEEEDTVTDRYQKNVTGIQDLMKHAISIFPVPSEKEVFVHYSNDFSGVIEYTITDLVGEKQLTSSFEAMAYEGQHKLPCQNLSPGVYLVTLKYGGMSEVFKIVLQK
jgi:alpha-amylase